MFKKAFAPGGRIWSAALVLAVAVPWPVAATPKEEKKEAKKEKPKKKRRDRNADDGAPKVGDDAPLFTLKTLDGKRSVDLSKFKGKKPVCLIFGSYT